MHADGDPARLSNWAGNVVFSHHTLHEPTSLQQLQQVVAASRSCRVLGSAHSFNAIADTTGDLVTLRSMPTTIDIDETAREVRVGAGTRYGELGRVLHARGWALPNLGSLPHISVIGACSTGTHGSGNSNGCLATAVVAIDIVTAGGDLVHVDASAAPESFAGAVVALGTLGAVVTVTLRIEPTYDIAQRVFVNVPWDDVVEHLDDVFAAGYSVSLFTTWRDRVIDQVWIKQRVNPAVEPQAAGALFDRFESTVQVHPVPGVAADPCTAQLGVAGPWHERLPHFRLDFTPSTGDELQSEYLIDRAYAEEALHGLEPMRQRLAEVTQVCELRTIAADSLWLSMAYARDSMAIHFTWISDVGRVAPVIAELEARLDAFAPRPHWGKVFGIDPASLADRYPRLGDAAALARQFDPSGVFRNAFTDGYLRDTR